MPRSFSLLLIATICGGGWYFVDGPGKGKFGTYKPPAGAALQLPGGAAPNAIGAALYPPAAPGVAAPSIPASFASTAAAQAPNVQQYAPHLATGPTIRIASFNIQVFGDSKAAKPYLMATLAAIIRNFHVIAIQEIRTQDDYLLTNFLRNYVNRDGKFYDYVVSRRLGRTNSTEQYAFIFDTSVIEVNRNSVYVVNDPDDLLHREPLVAQFRTRAPPNEAFTFTLVNIHTDPDETKAELDALARVYQMVRLASGGEDDIMILGDLNVDDQHLGQLGQLQGVRPIVRGVPTNTRGSAQYDNIVVHQPSTTEFTGRWGVYNVMQLHGLTLDQALQVSDHLPVWAEFSAYESAAPGRFATRGAAIRRE